MAEKILINGKWIETKEVSTVVNPYNGTVVAKVFQAGEDEAELAIESSMSAFESVRTMPSYKRAEILSNIADRLLRDKDSLAELMTLESGKPIQFTKGEVERAILTFQIAAEEAKRIGGEVIPLDLAPHSAGRWGVVRRFPIGPLVSITPFNFPLNLVAHKIAPAIAAGNSVIHKPPPQTPLTSLRLGKMLLEAGVPDGAVNIVPCNNLIAERICTDSRPKMLSFTGSPRVGWYLKSKAGKKKVLLELGGNAAVIVEPDADLGFAAKRLAMGAFSNAGQICISVQRIYVHKDIYGQFRDLFINETASLKVGNPLEEDTVVGPMISKAEADRASDWIENARRAGAKILIGGKREENIIEPTVLENVSVESELYCEEAFAPVAILQPYSSFDDAIGLVNDSRFGLQAGVFTNDARKIFKAFEEIQVGGVIMNDYPTYRIDNMPYGGIKDSGFGREGVRYAVQEMTEQRLLVVNYSR
ncbi:MAG: aldehyde dehydrogenase family protein [Candidatus Kryptoniota bacterium]